MITAKKAISIRTKIVLPIYKNKPADVQEKI